MWWHYHFKCSLPRYQIQQRTRRILSQHYGIFNHTHRGFVLSKKKGQFPIHTSSKKKIWIHPDSRWLQSSLVASSTILLSNFTSLLPCLCLCLSHLHCPVFVPFQTLHPTINFPFIAIESFLGWPCCFVGRRQRFVFARQESFFRFQTDHGQLWWAVVVLERGCRPATGQPCWNWDETWIFSSFWDSSLECWSQSVSGP